MVALAPLACALALRFAATAAVTAFAAAALVTVAALVEGHAPGTAALGAVAPLAGMVGAAWTIGGWRSAGQDVGLAGLGVAPAVTAGWLALLAAPLLWVGPGAAPVDGPELRLSPTEVALDAGGASVRWRWTERGVVVHRDGGDAGVVLPHLTPPTTRSSAPPPERLPAGAQRLLVAGLLLGWLAMRREVPGPAVVLIGATIAFVGSQLWVRLV